MAKITKDSKGKVKIFYDEFGNSLVVWFGSPSTEVYATEIDDDTVLMKDKDGNVIGFEKLNYVLPASTRLNVVFETVAA